MFRLRVVNYLKKGRRKPGRQAFPLDPDPFLVIWITEKTLCDSSYV